MLRQDKVDQIKRLLAEGKLSQRKIALSIGVSRGTVNAIANGKRRERSTTPSPWNEAIDRELGPPRRCLQCGGMVEMPCRLCHTRKLMGGCNRPMRPDPPDAPITLELNDDDQQRYNELRKSGPNSFSIKES